MEMQDDLVIEETVQKVVSGVEDLTQLHVGSGTNIKM